MTESPSSSSSSLLILQGDDHDPPQHPHSEEANDVHDNALPEHTSNEALQSAAEAAVSTTAVEDSHNLLPLLGAEDSGDFGPSSSIHDVGEQHPSSTAASNNAAAAVAETAAAFEPTQDTYASTQNELKESAPTTPTPTKMSITQPATTLIQSLGRKDFKWMAQYHELLLYKAKYGDCLVPRGFPPNPRLASWVADQRKQYKLKQDGRSTNITNDRIQLLEQIDFAWNAQEAAWARQFQALERFRAQHGHCHVPMEDPRYPQLGMWVKEQRRHYTLRQQGKHTHMTEQRVQLLQAMGFCWELHQATWLERWEELAAFKKEWGHCSVPTNYTANPKLATWVHHQRRQYRKFMAGKAAHITQERIDQLNALGFNWTRCEDKSVLENAVAAAMRERSGNPETERTEVHAMSSAAATTTTPTASAVTLHRSTPYTESTTATAAVFQEDCGVALGDATIMVALENDLDEDLDEKLPKRFKTSNDDYSNNDDVGNDFEADGISDVFDSPSPQKIAKTVKEQGYERLKPRFDELVALLGDSAADSQIISYCDKMFSETVMKVRADLAARKPQGRTVSRAAPTSKRLKTHGTQHYSKHKRK